LEAFPDRVEAEESPLDADPDPPVLEEVAALPEPERTPVAPDPETKPSTAEPASLTAPVTPLVAPVTLSVAPVTLSVTPVTLSVTPVFRSEVTVSSGSSTPAVAALLKCPPRASTQIIRLAAVAADRILDILYPRLRKRNLVAGLAHGSVRKSQLLRAAT
jgi:hypothetical protein